MSLAVARYWPWRMSDIHLVRCISAWIVCVWLGLHQDSLH